MNPEQLLNQCVQAMANHPPSPTGFWYITVKDNAITLVPVLGKTPPDLTFATITYEQLQRGLTCKEWNQLKTKLANYFFQRGLL